MKLLIKINIIPASCLWEDFFGFVGYIFDNSLCKNVERKQRVQAFSSCNKSSIGLTIGIVFDQPIYKNIFETIICKYNNQSIAVYEKWRFKAKSRVTLLFLKKILIHKLILEINKTLALIKSVFRKVTP